MPTHRLMQIGAIRSYSNGPSFPNADFAWDYSFGTPENNTQDDVTQIWDPQPDKQTMGCYVGFAFRGMPADFPLRDFDQYILTISKATRTYHVAAGDDATAASNYGQIGFSLDTMLVTTSTSCSTYDRFLAGNLGTNDQWDTNDNHATAAIYRADNAPGGTRWTTEPYSVWGQWFREWLSNRCLLGSGFGISHAANMANDGPYLAHIDWCALDIEYTSDTRDAGICQRYGGTSAVVPVSDWYFTTPGTDAIRMNIDRLARDGPLLEVGKTYEAVDVYDMTVVTSFTVTSGGSISGAEPERYATWDTDNATLRDELVAWAASDYVSKVILFRESGPATPSSGGSLSLDVALAGAGVLPPIVRSGTGSITASVALAGAGGIPTPTADGSGSLSLDVALAGAGELVTPSKTGTGALVLDVALDGAGAIVAPSFSGGPVSVWNLTGLTAEGVALDGTEVVTQQPVGMDLQWDNVKWAWPVAPLGATLTVGALSTFGAYSSFIATFQIETPISHGPQDTLVIAVAGESASGGVYSAITDIQVEGISADTIDAAGVTPYGTLTAVSAHSNVAPGTRTVTMLWEGWGNINRFAVVPYSVSPAAVVAGSASDRVINGTTLSVDVPGQVVIAAYASGVAAIPYTWTLPMIKDAETNFGNDLTGASLAHTEAGMDPTTVQATHSNSSQSIAVSAIGFD